ncbi:MAG: site-specific DNA-methyltransferase [Armatimonadota bacterium]|nr:site-specific DNA-methyltransferase [Armatimonadota bacterium]
MSPAVVYLADSRAMPEVADESIALVVTSPPYWHIKNYGVPHQIGYGQTLHEYLYDLARVWRECWRVLMPGRRLCINIGDQFARAVIYGQYKVIPLHAEIIAQCETVGFDYLGAIIWQKKTTMRPSGGAVVMGSFPYPPNGIVELDYEYILLFRKPGKSSPVDEAVREASALTRDEWKTYFSGHWQFGGERQVQHEAMFPEELPRRLIRMFSFVGETVLDPFVGSGTTLKVALELGRNAVGYEVQPEFISLIRQRFASNLLLSEALQVRERTISYTPAELPEGYTPRIKDARPLIEPDKLRFEPNATYRVRSVECAQGMPLLITDNGLRLTLLGLQVPADRLPSAVAYLQRYVVGRRVIVRFEAPPETEGAPLPAYIYLTNRLFINRKMIEMGLARAARERRHRYYQRFVEAEQETVNGK